MSHESSRHGKLISQKILVGFDGDSPDSPGVQSIIKQLKAQELGGVVLFRRNVPATKTPAEHRQLLSALKAADPQAFLAVDQEGGKVQRLASANGYFDSPSHLDLATTSLIEFKQAVGKMVELVANLGFNWNYAPCIDVDFAQQCKVIGALGRSFSCDPDRVVELARTFIDEHRARRVLSCVKHWPGHGSAQGDTHEMGVDVTKTWKDFEKKPYKALVASGHVDAVMTAHIIHTGIDNLPASISRKWIDILRKEIGYDGVVITDDLHMGGILKHFDFEDTVRNALHAGSDLLMFSNNPLAAKGYDKFVVDHEISKRVSAIIEEELRAGRYTVEQLEASAVRIAKLKAKLS